MQFQFAYYSPYKAAKILISSPTIITKDSAIKEDGSKSDFILFKT
jgi:hypothetical protein